MALLDFLRPKWSSGTMTEEDRQLMFWYLKRKSSYTAWKREVEAFRVFVDLVERQAREQPVVKDEWDYKTEWEDVYSEALKGLVHYEKALARLGKGDRTVFLYNSLGEFDDATTVSGDLHSEIVNGGHDFIPNKYKGKYIKEIIYSLRWWFAVQGDTGYLQPGMAGRSAVDTWWPERHDLLVRLFPPNPLPEVPAASNVTVRTNEPVPAFGIYEPQIKDGCMNYLQQGVPARSYSQTPVAYDGASVVWRLIWEDHRYEDGKIPPEEESYFPPEYDANIRAKLLAEDEAAKPKNQLIVADSRQMAPQAGRWLLAGDLNTSIEIAQKGDLMPMHNGRRVTWIWAGGSREMILSYSESMRREK